MAHHIATLIQVQKEGSLYLEAVKRGLSEVTQGTNGHDQLAKGSTFDEDMAEFQEEIIHRPRDLKAEALQSEQDNPVAGDAENGPGYHFDKAPTKAELDFQLEEVLKEFRQRPEYPIVSRLVQTTDIDENGDFILMPWWRWTVIQSWR